MASPLNLTRIRAFKDKWGSLFQFVLALCSMCVVFTSGLCVFLFIEGWTFVDSFYMMVITLSTVGDCILGCIYFGSSAAFNSFTGVATICLSASYGVPVLVCLVRGREPVRNSPYPLGRFGTFINVTCVVWIVFSVVIFCMPVALPVDASTMNYASVVFAGFAAIAFIWYFAYARKNFTGPPILRGDPTDPGVMVGQTLGGATSNGLTDSEQGVTIEKLAK